MIFTSRYLGMSEGLGINGPDMKQSLQERYFGRLNKAEIRYEPLTVRSCRSLCILLAYSSGLRLNLIPWIGESGHCCLSHCKVCNLREYFLKVNEEMHQKVAAVDNGLTPLSLAKEIWRNPVVLSVNDQEVRRYGIARSSTDASSVPLLGLVICLCNYGRIRITLTNNYRKYIIKDRTVNIFWVCHSPGESIRHIISGCGRLANNGQDYLSATCFVLSTCHTTSMCPVLENGHITLYWDRSIITDRTIVANKPHISVIPHYENLVKAEKDKQIKYLDLAHEVVDMWNLDSAIIEPIDVSAKGLIPKSFDIHLRRLALGGWIKSLIQKAVLLGTARIE
uniref:SFRICE_020923 n=1 Tax=Spodoptera frugiperda TaxID=7108 RepID=A0A2H1VQZ6_SPOFR